MSSIPYMGQVNGHPILMVEDRPFILLAGEVHNSNSSSLAYMEQLWNLADNLGMNCLLLPITWELVEPQEGQYDFSLVHGLIDQARAHRMKAVFLWFGTWKNAQCYYAPEWVKTDTNRFRRAEIEKGKGFIRIKDFYDMPYTSLSYLCEETMQADARAFAKMMAAIREYDGDSHTVVAVQVENETGIIGSAREHSDAADVLFGSAVPVDFAAYMQEKTDLMTPEMKMTVENGKKAGTWTEVFGREAEEVFSAYHVARYVNAVAEAGKKEYPLPMSVNCWLNQADDPAGRYPSGGPVSKVREVWRFCAPSIDIYAPDVYLPDFTGICDEYTRRGEALFIPECATHCYAAARNILCVGRYHAACYSPFGFENMGKPLNAQQMALFGADATDPALKTPQETAMYGTINHLLNSMMDMLTERYGTNSLCAGTGEFEKSTGFNMGQVTILANYLKPQGACLVLRKGKNEFYILAYETRLELISADLEKPGLDLTLLEEGRFENGIWQAGRRLNGDEAVSNAYAEPTLLHVRVFCY